MRSRTTILLTSVLVVSAVLAGCGAPIANPGEQTTENREIGNATEVRLEASGSLTLKVGDEPSLTVTAGENVLDRVTSRMSGDTLVLGTDRGWGNWGSVDYTLTLPDLARVSIHGSGDVSGELGATGEVRVAVKGSGDVHLRDLDVDEVRLTIDGSGDVELEGSATRQDVQVNGSGDYDGEDLDTREAVVDIAGSGDVDVRVRDQLDASVAGSGSIRYAGDPRLNSSTDGSGSIEKR